MEDESALKEGAKGDDVEECEWKCGEKVVDEKVAEECDKWGEIITCREWAEGEDAALNVVS